MEKCYPSGHGPSTLKWRHNERDDVSNHQPHDCWPNRLFRRRSNKTSKLRVTGLCAGNSPVTGEFPTQRASNVENVSIWWRHHERTWCHIVAGIWLLLPLSKQSDIKMWWTEIIAFCNHGYQTCQAGISCSVLAQAWSKYGAICSTP